VIEERPELVRHAAMLDPNAAASLTLDEIDALCDELTRAHDELLPSKLRAASTPESAFAGATTDSP
jgi:alpha-galactosidase